VFPTGRVVARAASRGLAPEVIAAYDAPAPVRHRVRRQRSDHARRDAVLQARIPGARHRRHVTLARAGHFLQEDDGPELAAVVVDLVALSKA
jgi:pimeloyl-ACP methyl ester carboxylesterase